MENESVAGAMNRALFLAPDLIGEDESDPLLQQALKNVEDDAARFQAQEAARAAETQPSAENLRVATRPLEADAETRETVLTLVGLLGRKYTSVIGGAPRTGVVAQWVQGSAAPTADRMSRLRLTYRLAQVLRARFDDATVRTWFLTKNQQLGDERPIALLGLQPLSMIEDRLLAAAASSGSTVIDAAKD